VVLPTATRFSITTVSYPPSTNTRSAPPVLDVAEDRGAADFRLELALEEGAGLAAGRTSKAESVN
jgi:hypothetical protein